MLVTYEEMKAKQFQLECELKRIIDNKLQQFKSETDFTISDVQVDIIRSMYVKNLYKVNDVNTYVMLIED
jgi:hypothetical protein